MRRFIVTVSFLLSFVLIFCFSSSALSIYYYDVADLNAMVGGPPPVAALRMVTDTSIIIDPYSILIPGGHYGQSGSGNANLHFPVMTKKRGFLNFSSQLDTLKPTELPATDGIVDFSVMMKPDKYTWMNSLSTGIFEYKISGSTANLNPNDYWISLTNYTSNDEPALGFESGSTWDWYTCLFGEQLSFKYTMLVRVDNLNVVNPKASDFTASILVAPYTGYDRRTEYSVLSMNTTIEVSQVIYEDDQSQEWRLVSIFGNFDFSMSNPLFGQGVPLGVNSYHLESVRVDYRPGTSSIIGTGNTTITIATGFMQCMRLDQRGQPIPSTSNAGDISSLNAALGRLSDVVKYGPSVSQANTWMMVMFNWTKNSFGAFSGIMEYFFACFPIMANLIYCLIFIGLFWVLLGSFPRLIGAGGGIARSVSKGVKREVKSQTRASARSAKSKGKSQGKSKSGSGGG